MAPKDKSALVQSLSEPWLSRSPCQYLLLDFWLSLCSSVTMSGWCAFGRPVSCSCSFGLSLNRDQYAKLKTPNPADACVGLKDIRSILVKALRHHGSVDALDHTCSRVCRGVVLLWAMDHFAAARRHTCNTRINGLPHNA